MPPPVASASPCQTSPSSVGVSVGNAPRSSSPSPWLFFSLFSYSPASAAPAPGQNPPSATPTPPSSSTGRTSSPSGHGRSPAATTQAFIPVRFSLLSLSPSNTFPVPDKIAFNELPTNPAIPYRPRAAKPPRYRSLSDPTVYVGTHGVGPKRVYLNIQSQPPDIAYPPRPVPGSIADMDIIMKHCDFSQNKVCRFFLHLAPRLHPSVRARLPRSPPHRWWFG